MGIEYIPEISYDAKVWIPGAVYLGSFDQINWEANLLPSKRDTFMRIKIFKP